MTTQKLNPNETHYPHTHHSAAGAEGTQTPQLTFVGGAGTLYSINRFEMNLPSLTGDLNIDGKVDVSELAWLSADWQNGHEMTELL